MKLLRTFFIALVLIQVGCSSVKTDTDYRFKNDKLYYKNTEIGYLKESKSQENDQEIGKNYSIILYKNINKDLILRDEIINYFLKKYTDCNTEVEVYTTLVK